ncbi:hypothetical protein [Actinoplanes friuliensis]|uniref:Uncharacterized protein n=1 Tax=Actinoplanes friuliensis DSM 7358 TaxID=1246995 RepID=U5VWD4_9ACTN|nr:hypothetical protein [Actinoplanes friuliensis]AGZ41313.1 hypothetical protein AFR_15155 [Actinoplanes friuliensis DSM 7358]
MNLTRRPDRLCDCHCPAHSGSLRLAYTSASCKCLVTCSTQPVTLLVKEWACALFLHPDNDHLWFVMNVAHGQWDWESAGEIDERADMFDACGEIEGLLRRLTTVLAEAAGASGR